MPRYRFKWANLPPSLLGALCRDLALDGRGEPAVILQRAYGARPSEEFIRETWDTLRESWLRTDKDSRDWVVEELRTARREGGGLTSRESQMRYLRSLNNSKNLRSVVWQELVAVGEADRLVAEVDGDQEVPTKREAGPQRQQPAPAVGPAIRSNLDATQENADWIKTVARNRHPDSLGTQRMATTTLADLERRLWGAANALRGPVDPADFKTYVFPMLFWKWISDTWEWEHRQAVEDMGDGLDDEVEADYHRFALPENTRWAQVTTKTDNIGSRIAKALGQIEQANARTLAGIFGDAAWGNKERLPETALVNLMNAFNGVILDPDHVNHDLLGQAYEYLLKNFADESGKKAGEFFTPRQVVHLLVAILDPQAEETIYDPASGSGGMLVETINIVRSKGADHRTLRLYAQEINLTTAAIARMNLYLHEIEDFQVVRGDTLRSPGLRNPDGSLSQFDVVIANPPFSLQNWGADTWPADPRSFCGVPPAKNGDYAWVQHMVSSMSDTQGRVGVVMPHGVLFRGGVEGKIRQCLIERDQLEAVIGLPPNLFYSTTIPASLLIFRARKSSERRNHVLFVDGSARFAKGRNQNLMTDDDSDAILTAYRTGDDPDGEDGVHVRLVPHDEIKGNGFDLNIGRYVRVEAEEAIDLATALAAYEAARAARIEAEQQMFQRLAMAGIADLASVNE